MTLVNINLKNVGSGTNPVDKVIFYSPVYRDGATSSELVSTAEYAVSLANGVGSINLAPGPVRVRFSVRGIADTVPKDGVVPDSGPVSLNDVIQGSLIYTPPVINGALEQITTAKNSAINAVEQAVDDELGEAVQTAVDAATIAGQAAVSADGRATSAESKVDTYTPRVEALEALGGLSPESPVDGQTANLISQADSLSRSAVLSVIGKTTGVISVEDYGAISDGTTDNTTAFNSAMTEARSSKRTVYVPAGRWKIDGTVDISGAHLSGEISGYQNTSGAIIVGNGANTALKQMSYNLPDLTMTISGLRIENVSTGIDLGYMVQTTVEDVWIHSSGTGIKFGSNSAVGPLWCMFKRVIADSSGGHGMVMQGNQWCNANSFDTCEFKGASGFAGVQIDTTGGYGAVKNTFKNCEFAGDGAGILLSGTTRSTTVADCYMESAGPAIVSLGLAIDLQMNANVYGSTGNDSGFGARFIDHQSGNLNISINGGWIVTGTDARQSGVVFVGSDSPGTLALAYTKKPHASTQNSGFILNAPELTPNFQSTVSPLSSSVSVRREGDVVRFVSTASVADSVVTGWTLPQWARPSIVAGGRPTNADGEIYVGTSGAVTLVGLSGKSFRFDLTYFV